MTYDFDSFKLKKLHQVEGDESKREGDSLDKAILSFIRDFTEKCVNNKDNLHITGEEVCLFLQKLYKKARKEWGKKEKIYYRTLSDLEIFCQIEYYYRFHIQDRKYRSFRVAFEKSVTTNTDDIPYGKLEELIDYGNDIKTSKQEANAFSLYSTLFKHIYQVEETSKKDNPHHTFNRVENKIENKTEEEYWKSGYAELNDYHKSELLTWHRLLREDNKYNYSVYPYCKFEKLDDQERLILLITTKLVQNYMDSKVKPVDKIEPIHMLVFKFRELYNIPQERLREIEFKLQYVIGYLSYAVFAGRTNENLKSISTEASKVSRFWYSTGIEKLFEENEEGSSKGMDFSRKFIEEILCANVEGLTGLEVFPFDRAFIFSGSNYRAITFDPATNSRARSPMRLQILETALKSRRPQDNSRFLSTMERIEKQENGQTEQPDSEIYFDITQKRIVYHSDCLIEADTDGWIFRIVDSDEPISEKLDKKIDQLKEFNEKIKEDLNLGEKGKIDAVINSLFAAFQEESEDELQKFCQPTFRYYDEDGLCFLTDFAVRDDDIKSLKAIQDTYCKAFFKKEKKEWEKIWDDNKANIPDIDEFMKFLQRKEAKVVLVSFDPRQNLYNMDMEGNRYLEDTDAFTILLVSDEDIVKNNYALATEVENLKQIFHMIIRRKLREAVMKKEVLRGQKKLFTTMMPSIMHQIKHLITDADHKNEVEGMMNKFKKIFEHEDFTPVYRDMNSNKDIYEYFLAPFIIEQLKEPPYTGEQGSPGEFQNKITAACRKYLEENIDRHGGSITVKPEKLECVINRKYFPKFQLRTKDEFAADAARTLLNNAVEHAALHAGKTGIKPEIIISFNLSPIPGNQDYQFELSIINNAFQLAQERLEILNAADPKETKKDAFKKSSTGLGLYIARTQLQKSIGKGADIKISNVGDHYVEASLILPANLVKKKPEESDTPIPASVDTLDYVLYVEDDPKYWEDSKKLLINTLGSEDKLFFCDNKKEAITKINSASPLLVLLDMKFYRVPDDKETPTEYCTDVIKRLAQIGYHPPVVILSNYSNQDFEHRKDDFRSWGYKFEIQDFEKEPHIKEKTIIFPQKSIKNLAKEEGKYLIKAVENWLERKMEDSIAIEKRKMPAKGDIPPSAFDYTEVDFNADDFNEKLAAYRTRNISPGIPDEIFVAKANVSDERYFYETIFNWFSQRGLKSFYPDEQYERFRTLLLNIRVPEPLPGFVDLKIRYWCLPYNILVTSQNIPIDSILAWKWKHTPHGARGTLSNLRHDLKNKITGEQLDEFISVINRAEEQLLFSDKELLADLNRLQKKRDHTIIEKLLGRGERLTSPVHRLFNPMNAIFEKYGTNPEIEKLYRVVQNLQYFLMK
jgi:hypothetical protein